MRPNSGESKTENSSGTKTGDLETMITSQAANREGHHYDMSEEVMLFDAGWYLVL